jgi:hypothetical protein
LCGRLAQRALIKKNDKWQPLMIHVYVCAKMITRVPLKNKSEEECTKALLDVKADHQMRDEG